MKKKIILGGVVILGFLHWYQSGRTIKHPPGILVAEAPLQTPLEDALPFAHDDFMLTPLADYEITARVLSKRNYRFDASSAISPTDLALGWQYMSDSDVLQHLEIDQAGRFYSYRTKKSDDFPFIPFDRLGVQSANTHIIPANKTIARQLSRVKKGQVITLRGYLVNVRRAKDGFTWNSSLTRTDSGAGACEVMWVSELDY